MKIEPHNNSRKSKYNKYKEGLSSHYMYQSGGLHRIRHTFATLLLREGANIEMFTDMLILKTKNKQSVYEIMY